MGSELLGAVIGVVSLLTGFTLGRAHRPRRVIEPPREVCQCDHGASMHDAKGCHGTFEVAIKWDRYGDPIAYENTPCACVRYVGPNSVYIPELDG